MNHLTEKWINDGSETKRVKFNMVNTLIGFVLLLSVFCFFIKSTSVEYIDETGILHENFYLIIIGYICLLAGIVVFLRIGIAVIKRHFK